MEDNKLASVCKQYPELSMLWSTYIRSKGEYEQKQAELFNAIAEKLFNPMLNSVSATATDRKSSFHDEPRTPEKPIEHNVLHEYKVFAGRRKHLENTGIAPRSNRRREFCGCTG